MRFRSFGTYLRCFTGIRIININGETIENTHKTIETVRKSRKQSYSCSRSKNERITVCYATVIAQKNRQLKTKHKTSNIKFEIFFDLNVQGLTNLNLFYSNSCTHYKHASICIYECATLFQFIFL